MITSVRVICNIEQKQDSVQSVAFPYLGIDMSDYTFNREEINAR
jgi:hypothetical protein